LPSRAEHVYVPSLGFVSAAEALCSCRVGLLELIYTRTALRDGEELFGDALVGGRGQIYLYHNRSICDFTGYGRVCALQSEQSRVGDRFLNQSALGAVLGVTLMYQPRLLDILPMYCVFLLMTPSSSGYLLEARRLVLLLSVGAWVVAQSGRERLHPDDIGGLPVDLGDFGHFGLAGSFWLRASFLDSNGSRERSQTSNIRQLY